MGLNVQPQIKEYFLGPSIPQNYQDEDREKLDRDILDNEVTQAIFKMGDPKCPMQDGFNALFYKKTWLIMGPYIGVKFVLYTNFMIDAYNLMFIYLIPRNWNPYFHVY